MVFFVPYYGTSTVKCSNKDNPAGITVQVDARMNRYYYIYYADESMESPAWSLVNSNPIIGAGIPINWLDTGLLTIPPPFDPSVTSRFYHTRTTLPWFFYVFYGLFPKAH